MHTLRTVYYSTVIYNDDLIPIVEQVEGCTSVKAIMLDTGQTIILSASGSAADFATFAARCDQAIQDANNIRHLLEDIEI